jgi:hypothetical protein
VSVDEDGTLLFTQLIRIFHYSQLIAIDRTKKKVDKPRNRDL